MNVGTTVRADGFVRLVLGLDTVRALGTADDATLRGKKYFITLLRGVCIVMYIKRKTTRHRHLTLTNTIT